MSDKFNVSFEILHLITVISSRFEHIFAKCGLTTEQMYILSYINSCGKDYSVNEIQVKIVQRSRLIKITREIFNCNDNKANAFLNKIEDEGFVNTCKLKNHEKTTLFEDGQNKVCFVTEPGMKKISEVVTGLKLLLNEIIGGNQTLLIPPYSDELGTIARGIMLFLKIYSLQLKVK